MRFEKGSVVIARSGRDRGMAFVVTDVLGERYVLIADGKRRPLEKPKKKNVIHLSAARASIGEVTSNRQLRKFLNSFVEKNDSDSQSEVN